MRNDPVIEPGTLKHTLQTRSCAVLDAREPAAYAANHLHGAVRVPIETWAEAARSEHNAFYHTAYWENAIRALGLSDDDEVVVYDDGRMVEAARVWFILQHFGAKVRLINGGWPALAEAGLTLDQDPAQPATGTFTARPGSGEVPLVDRHTLKDKAGTELRVLDTRSEAEHRGEDLKNNPRGGRLPGALNLPHTAMLEGGFLRKSEELANMLRECGFDSSEHIATHCDAGGRAALAAVAALRAGHPAICVYYLSFSDWARDESCPVIKDPQ